MSSDSGGGPVGFPAPDGPERWVDVGDRQLVALERQECLSLLASRQMGRLVFTYRALPAVCPVNFRVDGDSVLVRLEVGSAAATSVPNSIVAFQTDDFDLLLRTGWSVTVVGPAQEITDPISQLRVAALDLQSWAGDRRDHVISLATERITGSRLVAVGTGRRLG